MFTKFCSGRNRLTGAISFLPHYLQHCSRDWFSGIAYQLYLHKTKLANLTKHNELKIYNLNVTDNRMTNYKSIRVYTITWRINHLFIINLQYRHLLVIRPFDLLFAHGINLHNFVWNVIIVQKCWDTKKFRASKTSDSICKCNQSNQTRYHVTQIRNSISNSYL